MRATLQAEAVAGAEVSVLVTDDQEMQQLNCRYRDRDAPTDVLAFPQDDLPSPAGKPGGRRRETAARRLGHDRRSPSLIADSGPRLLGDVAISAETAQRQARERHASFDGEMQLLAIHGVLHLTGWTDDTDDQRRRMLMRARAVQRSAGGCE